MAISDYTLAKDAMQGVMHGLIDPETVIRSLFIEKIKVDLTDGGTAGTGVALSPIGQVAAASQVRGPSSAITTGVKFTAPIAVTAAAANNMTINVYKKTGAAAAVLIATGVTTAGGLGSLVAGVPVIIPLVAGQGNIAAADTLHAEIVKNAAGVAFAAATSFGLLEVELEPA